MPYQDATGRPSFDKVPGKGKKGKKGKDTKGFGAMVKDLRDEAAVSGEAKGRQGPATTPATAKVQLEDAPELTKPEYNENAPDSLPIPEKPDYKTLLQGVLPETDFKSLMQQQPNAGPAGEYDISAPPEAPNYSDLRAQADAEAEAQLGRKRIIPNATGGRGFLAELIRTGVGVAQGYAETGDWGEAGKRGRQAREDYVTNKEDTVPFDEIADKEYQRKVQEAEGNYRGKHQEYQDTETARRYEEEKKHRSEREAEEQRRYDETLKANLVRLAMSEETRRMAIEQRERAAILQTQTRLAQAAINLQNKLEVARLQAEHNMLQEQIKQNYKFEDDEIKQIYTTDPRDQQTITAIQQRIADLRKDRAQLIGRLGTLIPGNVNINMPGMQPSTAGAASWMADPAYQEYAQRIRNGEDQETVFAEMRQARKLQ